MIFCLELNRDGLFFMHFLKPTSELPLFTPLESPSGLFSVALKLFELLTYKFVTFPVYNFYTFSKIFRTIDYCFSA